MGFALCQVSSSIGPVWQYFLRPKFHQCTYPTDNPAIIHGPLKNSSWFRIYLLENFDPSVGQPDPTWPNFGTCWTNLTQLNLKIGSSHSSGGGSLNISTLEDYYYSMEVKYFGGDCSILLDFSQFWDMLWCIFFDKYQSFFCVCSLKCIRLAQRPKGPL